jgi:uncharacterized membrane protein
MMSIHVWHLRAQLRKVWVRVVGFAALACLSVVLARVFSPFLADDIALRLGSEAVADLLGVLTSSMLAVTTFSLSIAVSAFAAAAGTATPRATVLLQSDSTTQNVLATFLGAFLFGLVGLIALHAELYDASGKVVVFLFTVAVIGLVVIALIRWIDHLMRFGRMADTLDRVERAATDALCLRMETPFLGGRPLIGAPPSEGAEVTAGQTGHVQHIDIRALQDCAKSAGTRLAVLRLPGSFVVEGEAILRAEAAKLDAGHEATLRSAFAIGKHRTFDEDPRFGLIVLSEIGSRALSPGINDPGTAIDIVGRHVRILSCWREYGDAEVRFPDVLVPPVLPQDAIEDAFRAMARDGAGLVEVQLRLHKALASLRRTAPAFFAGPAARMAQEALRRAELAGLLPADLAAIRAAAQDVIAAATPPADVAPQEERRP